MLIRLTDCFTNVFEIPWMTGARMVYHRFIFHLSRCFRAAARAFALTFFAIGINSVSLAGLPHLQVAD